ncbi:MAG TPA: two-component regulator propeller domain-containing protein [Puia sp.]|nr:two-component regulator propeller domain-containing protein [Puia sp.]
MKKWLALLILAYTAAGAQLLPIRTYTTREGLNTSNISALLRDSRGILWVGTYNGVNWYDGARFLQPEMHTRNGQIYVTNFLEDHRHNIWVTSWYSGLYRYRNGRFVNYLIDSAHIESQSNSTFELLQLDSTHFLVATDRNVWQFRTPESDSAAPAFTLFDPSNHDLERQVNALAITATKDILIGYQKGITIYRHQGTGWVYGGKLWNDTSVGSIGIRGDQCWIASAIGLYYYPHLSAIIGHASADRPAADHRGPAGASGSAASAFPSPMAVYPHAEVDHLFIDGDNHVWFTTGMGASRLSGDPPKVQIQSYTTANGLPSDIVTAVLADQEGITWLGSEDGLARLNKDYYHFYPLREQLPAKTSDAPGPGAAQVSGGARVSDAGNATIIALNTDRDGVLWMGSYNGIFRMQGAATPEITRLGKKKVGFAFSVLRDSSQDLWVCSDGGILRMKDNRPLLQYPLTAYCGCVAPDGSLWFGCRNGRIIHRDKNGLREVSNPELLDERIMAIYGDRNGFLWVGYGLVGLKKFRPSVTGLQLVKEYTVRTNYTNMKIRSLGDDGHGHLLAGTRTNGLYVFDLGEAKGATAGRPAGSSAPDSPLLHITTVQGLSGNWIKATAAGSNEVFLATNNGLDQLDLSDLRAPRVHAIPFHNEQVPREINAISLQNDTIWLGMAKGVLQYIPRRQEKNAVPPPAYFMKVTIAGRTDSDFHPFTAEATLPDLSHRQNSIAFDFAGLSFRDEENVRYRYQMGGLDKDWSPVTDRRYVNYSNLSPGDYVFRVLAGNNDGVWSTNPATIRFHIDTPFWLTGWFITLCAVSLAALLYVFYRYRLQQALQIERLRTKISTDLHDDIGSTLSSISIMSDMILQENKGGAPDMMAREIKDNSLSLMDKMDDIVWSINPRNDALENMMARIQRFASQLFEAKGIDYEIEIGNNIRRLRLPMEYRQNVYLIMKEAINNLVKYADADKVTIKAGSVDHDLLVEINDNGKGFAFPENNSGNGIANMKSRAALMKASLQIQSEPGKGTTVILSLKMK